MFMHRTEIIVVAPYRSKTLWLLLQPVYPPNSAAILGVYITLFLPFLSVIYAMRGRGRQKTVH